MSLFDIRAYDSAGSILTTIEAPTYFEAAQRAAERLFKKPLAIRQTGWGGKGGIFSARSSADDPPISDSLFHVGDAVVVQTVRTHQQIREKKS
jgi:hypothetical protein